MILEVMGAAILGLVLALAAARRLPHRLPAPALVLPTGLAGAVFGGFVTHSATGAGNVPVILLGAIAMSTAALSLLLRPARRPGTTRQAAGSPGPRSAAPRGTLRPTP